MELKELIHPLEVLEVVGNADVEISGIQSDSRKVEKGFLFVAVRGTAVDGHAYIQSAIEKVLPQSSARKSLSFRMKICRYPKANRFSSG